MNLSNVKASFKSMKWYEWLMAAVMIVIAGMSVVTAFAHPESSSNPPWLTLVNFVSAVCGVFCIFFCAKASISNFAFAVVNTTVYMVYLWYWKIYGTFFLELLFYFPMNIVSWVIWVKHRDRFIQHLTMAKRLTVKAQAIIYSGIVVVTLVAHAILVRVGGTVAWLDAATLAIGMVAVMLEAFRYREQYILWIVQDVIAVAMYIVHWDAVYFTKKSIYLIVAVIGIIQWTKLAKTRNPENA